MVTTRRSTGSLPAPPVPASKDSKMEVDGSDIESSASEDDENDEDTYRPGKKAKLSQSAGGGKLKRVLKLGDEVQARIFGWVAPRDLLRLARTSRALRRKLMDRKSEPIWAASFAAFAPAIPKMTDFAYPALANLTYEPICNHCWKSRSYRIDPHLRLRMCEPCGRASVCSTSRIARLHPDYDPDLVEYARSSPVGGFAHSHVSSKNRFVYVPHLIDLEDEVARVENGRGGAIRLREWKEARAASLAQAELDANAIRDALHDLTKTPAGAKAKDQTRRDHEIRRRLMAEGYTREDVDRVNDLEPDMPDGTQSKKTCDDARWAILRPMLISAVNDKLAGDLRRREQYAVEEHGALLFAAWTEFMKGDRKEIDAGPMPTRDEFVRFEELRQLFRTTTPARVQRTAPDAAEIATALEAISKASFPDWRESELTRLLGNSAPADLPRDQRWAHLRGPSVLFTCGAYDCGRGLFWLDEARACTGTGRAHEASPQPTPTATAQALLQRLGLAQCTPRQLRDRGEFVFFDRLPDEKIPKARVDVCGQAHSFASAVASIAQRPELADSATLVDALAMPSATQPTTHSYKCRRCPTDDTSYAAPDMRWHLTQAHEIAPAAALVELVHRPPTLVFTAAEAIAKGSVFVCQTCDSRYSAKLGFRALVEHFARNLPVPSPLCAWTRLRFQPDTSSSSSSAQQDRSVKWRCGGCGNSKRLFSRQGVESHIDAKHGKDQRAALMIDSTIVKQPEAPYLRNAVASTSDGPRRYR